MASEAAEAANLLLQFEAAELQFRKEEPISASSDNNSKERATTSGTRRRVDFLTQSGLMKHQIRGTDHQGVRVYRKSSSGVVLPKRRRRRLSGHQRHDSGEEDGGEKDGDFEPSQEIRPDRHLAYQVLAPADD